MYKYFKVVMSWMCVVLVFTGFIPANLFVGSAAAASGELIWPNPGAINLTKTAVPAGEQGKWKVTLTVEGKNIQTSSDVVLLIDKSSSMRDGSRMNSAKTAAKKFVDNLLIKDANTRIALVTFGTSAAKLSDFKGTDQKAALTTEISKISAGDYGRNIEYTNIQSGLREAGNLLQGSTADNKVIVLLSDGAPTRSYEAKSAEAFNWQGGEYDFRLSNFDYSSVKGSSGDYELPKKQQYTLTGANKKKYTVSDNGIPTLSEAKLIQDQGYGIYSIGLEVGKDEDAQYVLNNVQNRGYFSSNSSDLSKVFGELSSKISYAAQDATVIDPMGDMFNLVGDPVVSQGEIKWDKGKETFTWMIGNVIEGAPATLTYTVQMDQSKNPNPNNLYPTNGTTTISYTDVNGKETSKNFEVPQVSFGKGSIKVKGYHVNVEGKPVNAEGVVVDRPDLAEQFYNDPFSQNGQESLDIGKTYSVTAKEVKGYQLKTGVSPAEVTLTLKEPTQTVWFGYANMPNSLKVEYKAGETVLEQTQELLKVQGEAVDITARTFDGYRLKDVQLSSGSGLIVKADHVTGSMPDNDVTITFNYEAAPQKVTVKYLERGTDKPLADVDSFDGVTNSEITLHPADVPGYTAEETSHSYKFTSSGAQEYVFYYTANEQTVTVKHLDAESKKELVPSTEVKGRTGETVNVTALDLQGYTATKSKDTYTITGDGPNEYVFYYTAAEQSVTVKYLDKDSGAVLANETVKSGYPGDTLELTAGEIAGYTPEEPAYSYTITTEEGQQHVFYYTANDQSVTVQYLERETLKPLEDETIVSGKTNQTVKLTAIEIPGYTPDSYTISYQLTAQPSQVQVFYYTKDVQEPVQRTVTIHYVYTDPESGEDISIADPAVQTGAVGDVLHLTAEPITVDDVVYSPTVLNYDYTIEDVEDQQYTFYYEQKEAVDVLQLLVTFLDRNTGTELGTASYQGREHDMIEIKPEPITVEDAVYKPEQSLYSYTFTGEPNQEFQVYYTLDEETEEPPVAEDQQVTVRYLQQETGAVLSAPTVKTGKPGDTLTLTAASISGYTAVNAAYIYTFTDAEGQEYIFYYTKNSTPVVTPPPTTDNNVTPLPPAPPVTALPPAPPTLDKENHYNYIFGYPDGMIKPLNNISREEVATIFYRLMDDATRSDYMINDSSFSDVGDTRWSNKAIATMQNAGIITGYLNGSFKPGQAITRAEFAAIASRFDNLDEQDNDSFSDISGHWAEKYIVSAANKGWIKGYPDGTFKPDQYITRAEAMAFINSVLNRKVAEEGISADAKMWPDNTPDKWYYEDVIEATNNHDYGRDEEGEWEIWTEVKPAHIYP
ncbi:hypothetical protein AWM70_17915 [Paenibacillus yonginensis]|uniref:VWFA domain-containing protein n=1 Tax=Paenibacillus yonginensis TaxID=1462996 RepID=A0A1B1N4B8_9BACL|nr:S-layer homology domain-containing protein [Paenibacillus yonginensis]ANS76225.1 hypothetical protein AWM70_17915 [Paenibacillus yonginensis]